MTPESVSDQDLAVPRCRDDLQIVARGGHWVVTSPDYFGHLILAEQDLAILNAANGCRSVESLSEEFGDSAPAVLSDARRAGLLTATPPSKRRVDRTTSGLEFAGADRLVRRLHDLGLGHLCGTGGALAMAATIVVAATLLLLRHPAAEPQAILAEGLGLLISIMVLTIVHEIGHAIVTVHHGRRVGPVGVGFYWGSLSFYVDATDALMLDRGTRILQAIAGCAAQLFGASIFVIVSAVVGNPILELIARTAAILTLLDVAINLVPFLQLDGYWALADAIDRPRLHEDAMHALRTRDFKLQRALSVFGLCSVLFGAMLFGATLLAWWGQLGDLVLALWHRSWATKLLAIALAGPVLASVALAPLQLLARRDGEDASYGQPPSGVGRTYASIFSKV